MLSLNPDITEPDKLVTLSTKKTVSKKKKSPTATPVATKTDKPSTTDDITSPSANTENITSEKAQTNISPVETPQNTEPPKKLAFKLKL
jgi:hypothetical protein